MIPPKPAARQGKGSVWRFIRDFRRDILSAQSERLYHAWMADALELARAADDAPELGIPVSKSTKGYLLVQDMLFGTDRETVDPETGEITRTLVSLLPTHFQSETNNAVLPVENPEIWVLNDPEAQA